MFPLFLCLGLSSLTSSRAYLIREPLNNPSLKKATHPIILYFFVGAFSGIYNDYLWASLILDKNLTMMTKMYSLVDSQAIQYGAMYALYIISSIPLIVTTVITMKYFKSGEFAAGLKL